MANARLLKNPGPPQLLPVIYEMGFLPEATVAIDVGAYIGTWSNMLSSYFEHVIAIEPNTPAFNALTANANKKVVCMKAAVSDKPGAGVCRLPRNRTKKDPMSMQVKELEAGPVKVITLDSLNFPGPVGLIKADVEGMEHKVVRGGLELIREHKPTLVLELESKRFGEENCFKCFEMLIDSGYSRVLSTKRDKVFVHRKNL